VAKISEIKVAIAGASGRMGQELIRAFAKHPLLRLVSAWDRSGSGAVGRDAGEIAGTGSNGIIVAAGPEEAMQKADVAVDFTVPSATATHLAFAKKGKTAMVIGTTGMSKAELAKVSAVAKSIPVVMASNFSIGVTVMVQAARLIAAATGDDYDAEIIDVHHHHKKDSPSGTAVTLLEAIAQARGKNPDKAAVYGRKGLQGSRRRGEIGVHALRAGDVVGDHTLLFAGDYERLELVHRSHSRGNFANGALTAATWLVGQRKRPGLYSMAQVLGLEK
jgi:4-hydroxy-tetrahydrodipicolinate reductase